MHAEEALEANRTLLEDSMELAHMAYWEYDVVSGMFVFNDRFYALYGTTAEREGGYQITAEAYVNTFVHPEDRRLVGDRIAMAQTTQSPETLAELGTGLFAGTAKSGISGHVSAQPGMNRATWSAPTVQTRILPNKNRLKSPSGKAMRGSSRLSVRLPCG